MQGSHCSPSLPAALAVLGTPVYVLAAHTLRRKRNGSCMRVVSGLSG